MPCIMRWPAKIPAGQETDNLVTSMDFLPTLAHYCGYAVPSDRVIDGHNVSGILEGESMASPRRLSIITRNNNYKRYVGETGSIIYL